MANIVVCAENLVTQAGLASMLTTKTHQIVGRFSSLSSLSRGLLSQHADLIVIESSVLNEDDLDQLIQITDTLLETEGYEEATSVLLLMGDGQALDEKILYRLSTEIVATGLASILPMAVSADQMSDAVRAILNGLVVLHPDVVETLLTVANSPFGDMDTLLEPLTDRETQVLNQMASGLTNRAIAQTINISEHTVKFHISAIFSKLQVSSRTEAVAVGIRHGLVML